MVTFKIPRLGVVSWKKRGETFWGESSGQNLCHDLNNRHKKPPLSFGGVCVACRPTSAAYLAPFLFTSLVETFFTEQQRGAESLKLKGLNIFSSSRSPGTQERNFRKKKKWPLWRLILPSIIFFFIMSPHLFCFPFFLFNARKGKEKRGKNLREKRPTVWTEPVTFPLGPKRFLSFFSYSSLFLPNTRRKKINTRYVQRHLLN